MPSIPGLRRFFRIDRSARRVNADVDEELRFHFDMKVQELVAAGMTPADARAEAVRRFAPIDARPARRRWPANMPGFT